MFEATCTECGKTTTVPFKPTAGEPVYCRACFSKRNFNRSENRTHARSLNFSFDSNQAWARRGDDWKGRKESEPTSVFSL
jgi:CxxC-x17-CxxC domain-containing protein